MTERFEQPQHLNVMMHQRNVRVLQPVLLLCGIAMSGMMLMGLRGRAAAGEQVAAWRLVASAAAGFLAPGTLLLLLRFGPPRRPYLEFRSDSLLLAKRGAVALRRFIEWSLSPDPIEPRSTRLKLTYRVWLGRKRWSMLLDNDTQVSELRNMLTLQLPPQAALTARL